MCPGWKVIRDLSGTVSHNELAAVMANSLL